MYSLTLIRLNAITMVFQNTEIHNILLLEDLEKEMANHHVDFDRVEEVLLLEKGKSKIVQSQVEDMLWFYYITRLN